MSEHEGKPRTFEASAPAKVNLHLGVSDTVDSGYHELVSVFQAVDRREVVRLIVEPDERPTRTESVVAGITTRWFFGNTLPESIDTPDNLAWRAVDAAVARFRDASRSAAGGTLPALPKVRIEVDKSVFVAGGMAGGSADAAAALTAAQHYINHYAGDANALTFSTEGLAAALGSDVPFCRLGGNAVGTGRGDLLRPLPDDRAFWWVFINPATTISTKLAFAKLDQLRGDDHTLVPNMDVGPVSDALRAGDPGVLATVLHNDLELPARLMRPQLGELLEFGNAEALRAIVSGSGPTVAMLCESEEHALAVRARVGEAFPHYESFAASGPAGGARVQS